MPQREFDSRRRVHSPHRPSRSPRRERDPDGAPEPPGVRRPSRGLLLLDEGEQIRVDDVGVDGQHAMRIALVDLERGVAEEFVLLQ